MELRYNTKGKLTKSQAESLVSKLTYSLSGITACELDEAAMEIVIRFTSNAVIGMIDETVEFLMERESKIRGINRRILKDNSNVVPVEGSIVRESNVEVGEWINGRVIRALDQLFEQSALERQAVERHYSPLIRTDSLHACSYLHTFPHNIYLVSAFPHYLPTLEKVRKADKGEIARYSSVTDYSLTPAVCFHAYDELCGSTLSVPQSGTPFLLTASAPCSRHEADWRVSGYRLRSFLMREIVMIGSKMQIEAYRTQMMEEIWELFVRLGLQGRIETAADPFYFSEDAPKGQHQLMADSKFELIVDTGREEFSVASFNVVGDTLCKSYRIHDEHGQPHHSGCIAFGLERWAFALGRMVGNRPETLLERLSPLLKDKGVPVDL